MAEWGIIMYNFDKLVDRRGTDCIKWDTLEKIIRQRRCTSFVYCGYGF